MKIDQDSYDQLKGTDWTYKEVAKQRNIDPEKFSHLMKKRFDPGTMEEPEKEGKDFHLSYSLEWAERVRTGWHWDAADSETREVLKEAGYDNPN